MGYIIDDWQYGDDCLTCFPPDKTPLYLMASFTDIKPGEFYDPNVHPPTPNKIFKMEQKPADPCIWEYRDVDYWVVFDLVGYDTSMILLNYNGGFAFFSAGPLPACTWSGISNYTTPAGRITYSGRYQIAWVAPVGTVSLRNAVEKMGFDPDDNIVVEWYPVSDNQMVVRVVRVQDHSTISAKHTF